MRLRFGESSHLQLREKQGLLSKVFRGGRFQSGLVRRGLDVTLGVRMAVKAQCGRPLFTCAAGSGLDGQIMCPVRQGKSKTEGSVVIERNGPVPHLQCRVWLCRPVNDQFCIHFQTKG